MVGLRLQEEEEGIGDVDLFTLTEDRKKLVVNVKWHQHLQVGLLILLSVVTPQRCWALQTERTCAMKGHSDVTTAMAC